MEIKNVLGQPGLACAAQIQLILVFNLYDYSPMIIHPLIINQMPCMLVCRRTRQYQWMLTNYKTKIVACFGNRIITVLLQVKSVYFSILFANDWDYFKRYPDNRWFPSIFIIIHIKIPVFWMYLHIFGQKHAFCFKSVFCFVDVVRRHITLIYIVASLARYNNMSI